MMCIKKGCQDPSHGHYVDGDKIGIPNSFRVGIVGSRRRNTLKDRQYVWSLIQRLQAQLVESRLVIVSGGCPKGADSYAKECATFCQLQYREYAIDTSTPVAHRGEFTQRAYARNRLVADDVSALFALVHSDRTGGTENTIKHMEEFIAAGRRKKVFLVDDSGGIYLSSGDQKILCPPDEPLPLF